MNEKPIVIVQTGHMRTGTTLLVNLLYGFMAPDEKIHCLWEPDHPIYPFHKYNIYKSHHLNIDEYMKQHSEKYEIFFVCTERDDKKIPEKYKNNKNVLVFDYLEILETEFYNMDQIINATYDKLRGFLPEHVFLDKDTCKTRIDKMNEKYAEIENMDFSHVDDFFQLHGRHRNRDTTK